MSKKVQSSDTINLTREDNSLIKNCEEVAIELNNVFYCTVKNLNILNYEVYDSLLDNNDHFTLKALAKWRNHPSITVIASDQKNMVKFLLVLFQ